MKESKLTSDKKNFNFEDEISKKNAKIEELMQQSLKHQEQVR